MGSDYESDRRQALAAAVDRAEQAEAERDQAQTDLAVAVDERDSMERRLDMAQQAAHDGNAYRLRVQGELDQARAKRDQAWVKYDRALTLWALSLSKTVQDRNDAVAMLREIEWYAETAGSWCPACGNGKSGGHTDDCKLGALLGRLEGR